MCSVGSFALQSKCPRRRGERRAHGRHADIRRPWNLIPFWVGAFEPARQMNRERRRLMGFSRETVENAWVRSHGRCECQRLVHGHQGRCSRKLEWENQGRVAGRGPWEAHCLTPGPGRSGDTEPNCQILCWDCYRRISGVAASLCARGSSIPNALGSKEPAGPPSERALRGSNLPQSMD